MSLIDETEEARDLVRAFQDSKAAIVGDGNGVISSIAAICGEEMTVPGDTEPADECSRFLTLGFRRGRLEVELLDRSRDSESTEYVDPDRLGGWTSVRICRPLIICEGSW